MTRCLTETGNRLVEIVQQVQAVATQTSNVTQGSVHVDKAASESDRQVIRLRAVVARFDFGASR